MLCADVQTAPVDEPFHIIDNFFGMSTLPVHMKLYNRGLRIIKLSQHVRSSYATCPSAMSDDPSDAESTQESVPRIDRAP